MTPSTIRKASDLSFLCLQIVFTSLDTTSYRPHLFPGRTNPAIMMFFSFHHLLAASSCHFCLSDLISHGFLDFFRIFLALGFSGDLFDTFRFSFGERQQPSAKQPIRPSRAMKRKKPCDTEGEKVKEVLSRGSSTWVAWFCLRVLGFIMVVLIGFLVISQGFLCFPGDVWQFGALLI